MTRRGGAIQANSKYMASAISRSPMQSSQKLDRPPETVADPSLGQPH
jgi:hypothetical protein